MTTDQSTDAEVLRKAADLVREHGLATGTLIDTHSGAVCALGSIYAARHGHHELLELYKLADTDVDRVYSELDVDSAVVAVAEAADDDGSYWMYSPTKRVWRFSDKPRYDDEDSQTSVIELLERTAEGLE